MQVTLCSTKFQVALEANFYWRLWLFFTHWPLLPTEFLNSYLRDSYVSVKVSFETGCCIVRKVLNFLCSKYAVRSRLLFYRCMYGRMRPVFRLAIISVVNLPRLKFLCFDKVNQLKYSSQLVITIKYFNVCRIFILSVLKKNYILQNTGPLDCGYVQQNKWKYTEIWYVESWLHSA